MTYVKNGTRKKEGLFSEVHTKFAMSFAMLKKILRIRINFWTWRGKIHLSVDSESMYRSKF